MPDDPLPAPPSPSLSQPGGSPAIERNLGEQPIARRMAEHGLKAHDLVAASAEQITHKMIARACKGRRLTPNTQGKVLRAFNRATGGNFALADLFAYPAPGDEAAARGGSDPEEE